MKNLKINLTLTLIVALLLSMTGSAFASDRSAIFDDSVIKMPSSLTEGKGTVSTSTLSGATLSYQFVLDGITASEISKIQRFEEEIAIAKAYNTYTENMIDSTDSTDKNLQNYQKLWNAYKAKYYSADTDDNAILSADGVTRLASSSGLTTERIDEWESAIETLYGDRGENWTQSSDGKTVELDLSTFDGTRYVVLWARYTKNGANQYRPQWYSVTGTKVDEEETENNTNTTTDTDNNTTSVKNETSNVNTTKISTGKSDGSTTDSSIPYTGAKSVISLIITVGSIAVISYVKYRKIK